MAKVFFMYNTTLERWRAGRFDSEGNVISEFSVKINEFMDVWRESDGVDLLTLRYSGRGSELLPLFENIPITDVASDKIGTPYANKAAFETATKDFFFRVGIDPTDTVLAYSKSEVDGLIAKSVFSEVLISTPLLHEGTGASVKIFETTIDPKLGVEGWMKFSLLAKMTGSNNHTFSVRVSNQSVLQAAPTSTTKTVKFENILYNKGSVTEQGGGTLGGAYGTSTLDLLSFSGLINDSEPMLISFHISCTIGDTFTVERLQLEYRK